MGGHECEHYHQGERERTREATHTQHRDIPNPHNITPARKDKSRHRKRLERTLRASSIRQAESGADRKERKDASGQEKPSQTMIPLPIPARQGSKDPLPLG